MGFSFAWPLFEDISQNTRGAHFEILSFFGIFHLVFTIDNFSILLVCRCMHAQIDLYPSMFCTWLRYTFSFIISFFGMVWYIMIYIRAIQIIFRAKANVFIYKINKSKLHDCSNGRMGAPYVFIRKRSRAVYDNFKMGGKMSNNILNTCCCNAIYRMSSQCKTVS